MEVMGSVDELNAALGLIRASCLFEDWIVTIDGIQARLVVLMGVIATLPGDGWRYEKQFGTLGVTDVMWIEAESQKYEAKKPLGITWARPGAEHSPIRAQADFARTIARRAERHVFALSYASGGISNHINVFLNRLSDILWVMARAG